ncbi:hypothetical protein Pint_01665 [Pistacia integerrima]|uniref:Uncharacterized protein n=1 Tax=Pistacia integerrima TaxID=434235 RepID=A0ACC0ZK31_9ROSI|nr:hypothetical protein Pint_01665 [Pistacia integerrima]
MNDRPYNMNGHPFTESVYFVQRDRVLVMPSHSQPIAHPNPTFKFRRRTFKRGHDDDLEQGHRRGFKRCEGNDLKPWMVDDDCDGG